MSIGKVLLIVSLVCFVAAVVLFIVGIWSVGQGDRLVNTGGVMLLPAGVCGIASWLVWMTKGDHW